MSSSKKTVLLSFDDDLLLDVRKVLFRNNISFQQYITFVIHKLVLEDGSAKDLLNRAVEFNQEAISAEDKEKILKISPANLYSMFEKQDEEERHNK